MTKFVDSIQLISKFNASKDHYRMKTMQFNIGLIHEIRQLNKKITEAYTALTFMVLYMIARYVIDDVLVNNWIYALRMTILISMLAMMLYLYSWYRRRLVAHLKMFMENN